QAGIGSPALVCSRRDVAAAQVNQEGEDGFREGAGDGLPQIGEVIRQPRPRRPGDSKPAPATGSATEPLAR
ncbi:MAG: hypothetical protein ABR569_06675, partial [Gaiellaceae bacterium]